MLEAVAARHPVIEALDGGERAKAASSPTISISRPKAPACLLITGPNMGGKTTYLRQAALLVIMAQMGCFVPADSLRFGLVDRIYTRIGASDNVARGRSTFMVEMTETATILNTATQALADPARRDGPRHRYLRRPLARLGHGRIPARPQVGARTLFATHYHELTLLAEKLPRLRNLRVGVKETPGGIVFLHTIEPGAASKSYGIEVARLAGLPALRHRARPPRPRAARKIREAQRRARNRSASAPLQLTIFTPLSQRIVDRITDLDTNTLTPLQALNLLEELKSEIRDTGNLGTLPNSKPLP